MIVKELVSVCLMTSLVQFHVSLTNHLNALIKWRIVDIIIYNLLKDDSFWRQTFVKSAKSTICCYIKFIWAQRCYALKFHQCLHWMLSNG